ncbi:hypothetical protein MOQ72_41615 [Saccharopolyspora sp. K220]|uniref:hypothetical protein n=1 Tax=Saccharopolyspora soli TaxID=2926618 RepID=UPI001F5832ED|nr:hypothetical protein [Saccharopolyspora soli]MCI2423918.1 hypothetical protein [Saccharopolyspora soli]
MKSILLAALVVLLAGCASQSADPQVRQQLIAQVDAVKAAALSNDRAAAEAALGDLNREIATAQAQGTLDPDDARAILAAADRVAEDVRTIPLPEPPPPAVVTVTPDPPDEEQTKTFEEQRKRWEQLRKQWEKQHEDNDENDN